ncbi:MAG: MBL fold metallo-hydrolase [Acidobacteriota bacterium]
MVLRFAVAMMSAGVCAWAQEARITWIGQSCYVVQSAEGKPVVITDPPAASVGYALPAQPADAVTISHNHSDHNNSAGVRGDFTLVDGRPVTERQEMTAAGMRFVLVPGFHDNQNGAQRGRNTIIVWTQAGLKFAHLGDYGQDELSEAQLAELRDVDVLFVPAGGFFTIDTQRAAALVNQLRPRVAILMHFRTALGGPAQLATFPDVANPFGAVAYKPATVTVSRASLPAQPEVWLMEAKADAVAVNAAGFTAGAPVAPGSLVALFGAFTGSATARHGGFPLPRKLGETEVLVGASAVPLLYASPAQINFQAPARQASGQPLVEVRVGGERVARAPLTVVGSAPGLFAALNQDGRLNSRTAPARRGQVLQIFATGQGEVRPAVEDGAAAPASPAAVTPSLPEVYFGEARARVEFSGLAPGWAGLWQINVVVPADAPTGPAVPLVVIHGTGSNVLPVAVE